MVNTKGEYKLCCSGLGNEIIDEQSGESLYAHEVPIEQAFQSSHYQRIRKQMLAGERPPECACCWKLEDTGAVSFRQEVNRHYELDAKLNQLLSKRIAQGKYDLVWHLEIRPGNICNLKCAMCQPVYSSSWQGEVRKIEDKEWKREFLFETSFKDEAWWKRPKFREHLKSILPSLEFVTITGGEFTLAENHLEFLGLCAETGHASHIDLSFFTNATYWNPKLIKHLHKFRSVAINISADGVGSEAEYIRYPSKWAEVDANIRRYIELGEKFVGRLGVNFMITYSALNILSIREIAEYVHSLREIASFTPVKLAGQILHDPPFQTMRAIPRQYRGQIVRDLNECKELLGRWWLDSIFEAIREEARDLPYEKRFSAQIFRYFSVLDERRGTKFREALPKLYAAIASEENQVQETASNPPFVVRMQDSCLYPRLWELDNGKKFFDPEDESADELRNYVVNDEMLVTDLHFFTKALDWDIEVIATLRKFRYTTIYICIDAMEGEYDYFAKPYRWDEVRSTIDKYVALGVQDPGKYAIHIAPTLSILNIFNYLDLAKYVASLYRHAPTVDLKLGGQLLGVPENLSLQGLPISMRRTIVDELEKISKMIPIAITPAIIEEILQALQATEPNPQKSADTIRYLLKLDDIRGTDFRRQLPRLSRILEDSLHESFSDSIPLDWN